jgi:hypothetical protein
VLPAPDAAKVAAKQDAGSDASTYVVPPGCPSAPSGGVLEAADTFSFIETPNPLDGGWPDGVVNSGPIFTPDSRRVVAYSQEIAVYFEGPTQRGTRGSVSFDIPPGTSTDNLIGVPLSAQRWDDFADCADPSTPGHPVEYNGKAVEHTLRDGAGHLIFVDADTPTRANGVVFHSPEITPEFSLRWVELPNETCPWQRKGLELTVIKTKAKAVGQYGRRAEVVIDGQPYMLDAGSLSDLPAPAGSCGNLHWILYKKGFLHPA